MRRNLVRGLRWRLVPPWGSLVVVMATLGTLGLMWSIPLQPPLPPAPPPPHHQQGASAAPTPRHVTRSLAELGLSGPLAPRGLSDYTLLLNRVPKAGSELLALLLQRLQPANGFRLLQLQLPPLPARRLAAIEQEELVVQVTNVLRSEALPVAFHGAVYFTNFTNLDRQSPTFLSLVRNPVDRVMAGLFLTDRRTDPATSRTSRIRRKIRRTVDEMRNNLHHDTDDLGVDDEADAAALDHLDSCLTSTAAERPELCAWLEPQTAFFCGHDSRCSLENGEWTLKRAMANIDQYYPVVGVLEELNATLSVLESRLPLFFTGVGDVYRFQLHEPHANWDRSKLTDYKPEIRRRVQKRLALEYELYIWAKQRLMLQQLEDLQKMPLPGEAGEDRIAHSIHKRAHSKLNS